MKKKSWAAVGLSIVMAASVLSGCGTAGATSTATSTATSKAALSTSSKATATSSASATDSDQAAADKVAALIDAIYVQERTDDTDAQCEAAKKGWDALTDAQKALVSGENADPDYFGRDTGDASKDDPLNEDNIGENELLCVSFEIGRASCRERV